jgi:ATP-binding cassette subfamily B protein
VGLSKFALRRRSSRSRAPATPPPPSGPARQEIGRFLASLALYTRMLPYVRAECWLLLLTVLAMVGATVVTLGRPWPMQVIVDSVLGGEPTPAWIRPLAGDGDRRGLLGVAVALMAGALALGLLLNLAQDYASQLLGQRMVLKLRCDLYAKLQRLSLKFHDRSTVGDLIYRITEDAVALQHIVTYGFVPLVIQFITAGAVAATLSALDARLGLLGLAVVPLLILWTIWSSGRVRRRAHGLARADSTLYSTVSEVLGSIRAVKSFAMEDVEQHRFETRARASQREYVRIMALTTLGAGVTEGLAELGVIAVVFFGALVVLQGDLTVGALLVFVAYLHSLYGPITQLAGSAMVIQRSAASVERVVQILDEEDERGRSRGGRLARVSGRLRYDNVAFGYEAERAALQGVSLEIGPGERVAFVGRSGAGKTTLLSLLLRFYEPHAGRICLDGVDIQTLDVQWLRRQIALVLQEPIIFGSSLQENIAYGRPGATESDVMAASQAAGLHEWVATLPDGYATAVGERGVRLSGGQRQRLSIARAFLKDAPILVLDEPTSNLDASTERHIFESLDRLAQGRTTLVISHRLATAQRADRIVVLEAGRVVEQGTHRDLVAAGGAYAALWRDQAEGGALAGATAGARPGEWRHWSGAVE